MKYAMVSVPFLSVALTACMPQPAPVVLANPAATFCADSGGIYTPGASEGAPSTCTLPDGRVVDAFAYFRANAD